MFSFFIRRPDELRLEEVRDGSIFSLQPGGILVSGAVPIVTNFVPIPFAIALCSIVMPAAAPPGGYEWQATLVASGSPST